MGPPQLRDACRSGSGLAASATASATFALRSSSGIATSASSSDGLSRLVPRTASSVSVPRAARACTLRIVFALRLVLAARSRTEAGVLSFLPLPPLPKPGPFGPGFSVAPSALANINSSRRWTASTSCAAVNVCRIRLSSISARATTVDGPFNLSSPIARRRPSGHDQRARATMG